VCLCCLTQVFVAVWCVVKGVDREVTAVVIVLEFSGLKQ
jgi:hypothetical protein